MACSSRLEGNGAGWEPSLGVHLTFLGSSEQTAQVVSGGLPSASKGPWSHRIGLCLSASRNLFLNSA